MVKTKLHPQLLEAFHTISQHPKVANKICARTCRLEDFFSAPEFTSSVRAFVDQHEDGFGYVAEGEEQPLGNYDVYLKYTKLIEELLESFLSSHGMDHEVLCVFACACVCTHVGLRAS